MKVLLLLMLMFPLMACEPETRFERNLYLVKQPLPGAESVGAANLGGFYLAGEEVPKNYILAYSWYSISLTQGFTEASPVLASLEQELTTEQIALAQEIAAKCFKSGFIDCGY
jgi:TPR repeat protein